MDAVKKAEWVTGLRSKTYAQGRKHLRRGDRYCCFGVLCEVCQVLSHMDNPNSNDPYCYTYEKERWYFVPPSGLRKALGIDSEEMSILMRMNDSGGNTFEEIADYIEEHM